ncbi:MAG: carboxypeptidase-like regulatory domain-containing protein, partial [Nanoarchaeota archaeon]|nr:carboxypeptidase-like regulatory domain-containing protein [Nanoarchaeota archaeon]
MKKRGILGLVLVISIIAVIFFVKAQAPTGICYTTLPGDACAFVVDSCAEFGSQGAIYEAGGNEVYAECVESLGCCCYGEIEGAILSSEVCIPEYIDNRTFDATITNSQTCAFVCRGEVPLCESNQCGQPNTAFPCMCGTTEIAETNPFCCAAGDTGYLTKDSCLFQDDSACKQETFKISGIISDETGQALEGVRVTTGTVDFITAADGVYVLTLLPPGGYTVAATKTGHITNQSIVVITNDNITVNLALETVLEELDSDGDGLNDAEDVCPFEAAIKLNTDPLYTDFENLASGFCGDSIDNDCDGEIDCQDSGCIATDPACAQEFCGDAFVSGVEECDIVYGLDGVMRGDDSACPGRCNMTGTKSCRCEPICGDNLWMDLEICEVVDEEVWGCPDSSLGCWRPGEGSTDCTCKPASICGDHIISGNEECDFDIFTDFGFNASGDAVECIRPGESRECHVKSWSCGDGVIHPYFEQCEDGVVGSQCSDAECNDITCKCPPGCTAEQYTADLDILLMPASYNVSLNWDSVCLPSSYTVYRNGEVILQSSQVKEFIDDSPKDSGTLYCYQVKSYYTIDGIPGSRVSSPLECITTGDDICSQETSDQFCNGNTRVRCGDDNRLEDIENCDTKEKITDETYVCTGPDNDDLTECQFQSKCDECNDVLGLFWRQGRTKIFDILFPCENIVTCYTDFSDTSVDKYYSCTDVNTCYDYRSKDACQQNRCTTEMDANPFGCEWLESSYNETGHGVCRPIDSTKHDCSRCNEPYNAIFGDCNREICGLYGNCYYDYIPLNQEYACRSMSEIDCEDYDTSEDCSGGTNVVVDVDYDYMFYDPNIPPPPAECMSEISYLFPSPCVNQKIYGTNEILQRSDDFFGFGLCEWENGGCFKDADNKTNIGRTSEGVDLGDCFVDHVCRHDFEPPMTLFDIPPVAGKNFVLDYFVSDNIFESQDIVTYYTIVPKNVVEYPMTRASAGQISLNDGNVTVSNDYTIYYFSEDKSHNLEQVKSFDLFIDTQPPEISIETIEEPFVVGGVYYTNLTIVLNANDDTFPNSTCMANLTSGGQVIPNGFWLDRDVGEVFSNKFLALPDGDYILEYWCSDAVGNSIQGTNLTTIDADISITDPLPFGPINIKTGIEISVKTEEDAECRYSSTPVPLGFTLTADQFAEMTTFTEKAPDGKFHRTPGIEILGPDNISVMYYVRCKFPDGTFRGTASDNIKFAVDLQPPVVSLKVNNDDLQQWYVTTPINVEIKCKDPEIKVDGIPVQFDNCNVFYCEQSETCTPLNRGVSTYSFDFAAENQMVEKPIRYFAMDDGNNAGEIISETLRIDRIRPEYTVEIRTIFGEIVDLLTFGDYFVAIYPSENMSQVDTLRFDTLTSGKSSSLVPGQFTSEVWGGWINLRPDNFSNVEDNASFSIFGLDEHGLGGSFIIDGKDFYIDTKVPDKPVLEPGVETYAHLVNGVYYTNQDSLFVSGYTGESSLNISFYKDNEYGENKPRHVYTQILNPVVDVLTVSSGSKGQAIITFIGDVSDNVSVGDYLEFNHYRKNYPNWKNYYEVVNVQLEAPNTAVTLEVSLEENVDTGSLANVYKSAYPSNWFKQQTVLTDSVDIPGLGVVNIATGLINISIDAKDKALNPSESVSFSLLWDKIAPEFFETGPRDGWVINDNRTSVFVKVRELLEGSGIDNSSLDFRLSNDRVGPVAFSEECLEYECINFVYNSDGRLVLSEDVHQVNVSIKDVAGNKIDV